MQLYRLDAGRAIEHRATGGGGDEDAYPGRRRVAEGAHRDPAQSRMNSVTATVPDADAHQEVGGGMDALDLRDVDLQATERESDVRAPRRARPQAVATTSTGSTPKAPTVIRCLLIRALFHGTVSTALLNGLLAEVCWANLLGQGSGNFCGSLLDSNICSCSMSS